MRRYILPLFLLVSPLFAQTPTDERIKQIRADYAEAQEMVKEQTGENNYMNWNVRATVHRIEAGVGLVIYEDEYYSLCTPQGHTPFYRCKRTMDCNKTVNYLEILYTAEWLPEFYYNRFTDEEGTVTEERIYWNPDGTICRSTVTGEWAQENEKNAYRYATAVVAKYEHVLSEGLYNEEEQEEE